MARLAHATSTVAAVARGAKLIVVDPRKAGLASKADHWLRVRPGTDAALALSLSHVMIENGWYDADFVRDWTNASEDVGGERVWNLLASRCAQFPPEVAAAIRGVPEPTLSPWRGRCGRPDRSRSTRGAGWSGTAAATQTIRAIDVLYAPTGSLDVPRGNVLFEAVPSNPIDGAEFRSDARQPAVGVERRPLGPARFEFVTGEDFYTAASTGGSRRGSA